MNLSIILMKVIRRGYIHFIEWYRKNAFYAVVKKAGSHIYIKGPLYLWCNNIFCGSYINFYPNVTLWGPGNISIGSHVEVGISTTIYSSKSIIICDNVSIAANCYIIDSNHGTAAGKLIREQSQVTKGEVVIGKDVWLGAGVTILSGVHIGDGAVIGAGAVVNTDIPENAIAVGIPAKVVKYRS